MRVFKDLDSAERTIERIEALVHEPVRDLFDGWFERCSDPDLGLIHLERWLKNSVNPSLVLQHLSSAPKLAQVLIGLLGSSQLIASILEQNPELGSMALDPEELMRPLEPAPLRYEGLRMLESSNSYRHKLDRLRFLKQKAIIKIALCDVIGLWKPHQVWRALSHTADVIVELARQTVWSDFAADNEGMPEICPVSIIALGKLGGQELNFSSDIDLVYVLDDEADAEVERVIPRFCEKLRRALSERMFRGLLYRVDLRLRPFGKSGPVVSKMKAVEAYYDKFAEPWEHMALIRSRAIAAPTEIIHRWRSMRDQASFKPQRGNWVIDEILTTRDRLEEISSTDDIKRASGGIRDAEFIVQVLQLLHGHSHPELKGAETHEMLEHLKSLDLLNPQQAQELRDGYTRLREVEHQCQIEADQQTHEIPKDPRAREELARRLGFLGVMDFEAEIGLHRARIKHWYREILSPLAGRPTVASSQVLDSISSDASAWISSLPDAEEFWESLAQNESSLERVQNVADRAPALIPWLKTFVAITEQVITGEILEEFDPAAAVHSLPKGRRLLELSQALRRGWLRAGARWSLEPFDGFGQTVGGLLGAGIERLAEEAGAEFSIIALGSLGSLESTLNSDADLLFIHHEDGRAEQDMKSSQKLLSLLRDARTEGAPLDADLRLRPEGRIGQVVAGRSAFLRYAEERLEPWERMALSRSRLVCGPQEGMDLLRSAVLDRPLTPDNLDELLKMKTRIETERVSPGREDRNLKLGPGGIDDCVWLAHLTVLCWPDLRADGLNARDGLDRCVKADVIDESEAKAAQEGHQLLTNTRIRLGLLGLRDDELPAEPDKLERLGRSAQIEPVRLEGEIRESKARIRAVYRKGIERLKRSWS
jgi:glutamate-ammonia-ligase adenylyltransferase